MQFATRAVQDSIPTRLDPQSVGSDIFVPIGTAVAAAIGTADVTAASLYGVGGGLDGKTVIVNSITFTCAGASNTANLAAFLAAMITAFTAQSIGAIATGGPVANRLQLSKSGASNTVVIGAGTANTVLGLTADTYTQKTVQQYVNDVNSNYVAQNFLTYNAQSNPINGGSAASPNVMIARGIRSIAGGVFVMDGPWGTKQSYTLQAGEKFYTDIIAVYPDTAFTDGVLLF